MSVFNKVYASDFIDRYAKFNPDYKIKAIEFYKEYQTWCCINNAIPKSKKWFYKIVEVYGVTKRIGAGNNYFFVGIELKRKVKE